MTTSGSGGKLEREESGLRPAVTAKNYMPCAKVLPLHYSNIKSTRVAVFAIFLRLPPQRRRILLQGIFAQSDKVRSVVQNFFRDSRPAHMVPTRRQPHRHSTTRGRQSGLGVRSWVRVRCLSWRAEIIRCILITIQINEIIVIILSSRRFNSPAKVSLAQSTRGVFCIFE